MLCFELDVLNRVPDPVMVYAVQEEEDNIREGRTTALQQEVKCYVQQMLEGEDRCASKAAKILFAMLCGVHWPEVDGDEWRKAMAGPGGLQMVKGFRRVLDECGDEARYNTCRLVGRFADGHREAGLKVIREKGLLEAMIQCIGLKESAREEGIGVSSLEDGWSVDESVEESMGLRGEQRRVSESQFNSASDTQLGLTSASTMDSQVTSRPTFNLPATALFALYRCVEPSFARGLAGTAFLEAEAIRSFHRCR